jgi:hypothetical protein
MSCSMDFSFNAVCQVLKSYAPELKLELESRCRGARPLIPELDLELDVASLVMMRPALVRLCHVLSSLGNSETPLVNMIHIFIYECLFFRLGYLLNTYIYICVYASLFADALKAR